MVVLAAMPVYLAVHGAPSLVDTATFTLAIVPLFAAILVSRSGNLLLGHILCIAAMLGLAVVLVSAEGSASMPAMVWLALAPVEAYLTGSAVLVLATGITSLVLAIVLLAAKLSGWIFSATAASDTVATIMIAVATFYSVTLVLSALRIERLRTHRAKVRAARYRSLTKAVGEPVFWLDRTGAVSRVGEEATARFGLPQQEFSGRGLFNRIHVADRPEFLKTVSDVSASLAVSEITFRMRIPGPADKMENEPVYFAWVEMRARKISVDDKDSYFSDDEQVIAVLRDITQFKAREMELEAAKQQAELANLWKDKFLANVSHELRTPLNAIIGFSEILGNNDLLPSEPAKRTEYANIIRESGEHLLSVVNSILDISKIESGSFEIVAEEFEVAPVISNCIDMLQLKAEETEVNLDQVISPSMAEIIGDKRAFKQIVINLLSNAIKFTPEGGHVTVEMRPEGNSAVLKVRDNGIGIHQSELAQVGVPFFQASDTYDRPYEGTGLGLSVVRGLVGLHGGTISIQSAPSSGTCVTVKLPVDCRHTQNAANYNVAIEAIPLHPETLFGECHDQHDLMKKIA